MKEHLSRRKFIKLAAAAGGATIGGFDLSARSWVTQAQVQTPSFQSVPKLDGALLFDEASRRAIAVDRGNLFHRIPAAVLRPGSVQDVITMVQYANQHALKIAIKGQGHSVYGQTQAEAGIVIDSSTLSTVYPPTTESVDAQFGALWADVATATLPKGLTPRVFPATCMALTVGGTLSVGGLGNTSHLYGAQVDNVTELEVVTGDGRLVTCSPAHESELFNMVLAGLGQCGIIVRARIPLIPAPSHVLLHHLLYTDLDKYLGDQLRIARDGRFQSQRGVMSRNQAGQWSFTMEVGQFFSPPAEPNLAALESGLQFDSATPPVSMTYQEYLYRFEARNATQPINRPSPYIVMWIPASATKDYLAHIFALSPEKARLPQTNGVETFSCFPLNTRRFTCPLFKVPTEEQAFSVSLFRSVDPGYDAALSAVLASNRALLAKMTEVGGKRYTPNSMVLSQEEWQVHFGSDVWQRLSKAKQKYDPNSVLSPEPAMFGDHQRSSDA
ncbi:MAG TPA: FAD-binding protein [Candidatus Binatia bacterium]|nr:FAD-binding protein [Candidatus Binatia bacterium]